MEVGRLNLKPKSGEKVEGSSVELKKMEDEEEKGDGDSKTNEEEGAPNTNELLQ